MKYINKMKVALSAMVLCLLFCSSCRDWLEVQQKDSVLEDQVYSNEGNIKAALNGLYLTMAKQALYGRNLSFYTTEILAQRYQLNAGATSGLNLEKNVLVGLDYYSSNAGDLKKFREHIDALYFAGYNLILDINFFIKRLDATESVVIDSRKDLMLGEAYALRAFMHFDLLRLFGPVHSADPDGISIPYCTEPTNEWQERQSSKAILSKILVDIEKALVLLQNDPIISNGVIIGNNSDDSKNSFFYTDYRNRRMNYYAVQAFKVRVLMYSGEANDKQEAGILAKSLLESPQFNAAFPWANAAEINKSREEDRIFSKEVVFGIHVNDMYSEWEEWFNPGRTEQVNILGYAARRMNYMFGSDSWGHLGDWRAASGHWTEFPINTALVLTNKFKKTEKTTDNWYFQPLIRKTELHLAAAEVFQDVNYLDEVRTHRGLRTLAESGNVDNLDTEIEKEYMKEFVSEGQLWFFYKRRNQNSILHNNGVTMREVKPEQYVLPLPKKEVDER